MASTRPGPTLRAVTITKRRAPARPSRVAHPWRAVVVLGTLVVVVNLFVLALHTSDTSVDGRVRPSSIQTVTPLEGQLVRLQDTVGVDLRNDLTGVLLLDGAEIPEDQLERVVPLGQISFRPGPGKDLVRFEPGLHTLTVLYWQQGKDRPTDPGQYGWSFRAGA